MPADAYTPEGFDALQRETLERKRRIYPFRVWRPSALGHVCDRFLVWSWIHIDRARLYDWVLQSIFDEGKLHQSGVSGVYARLEEIGYEIVRESDRPAEQRVGDALIAGTPDGRIVGFRGARIAPSIILEAKSMQDYQVRRIQSVDDLLASRQPHVRSYYVQVQTYMFIENLERAMIALKSKGTGLIRAIFTKLDYDFVEKQVLRRVERLDPMVKRREDPPPIPYEGAVCGRCPFLGTCYPPRSFGEGASVIDDTALIDDLERREQLRAGAKEYEDLDDEIKARLKREGIKWAIAGPFLIEGKIVPKHMQARAAHVRDETHYKIERIG